MRFFRAPSDSVESVGTTAATIMLARGGTASVRVASVRGSLSLRLVRPDRRVVKPARFVKAYGAPRPPLVTAVRAARGSVSLRLRSLQDRTVVALSNARDRKSADDPARLLKPTPGWSITLRRTRGQRYLLVQAVSTDGHLEAAVVTLRRP
jgi:hypothetical protein